MNVVFLGVWGTYLDYNSRNWPMRYGVSWGDAPFMMSNITHGWRSR